MKSIKLNAGELHYQDQGEGIALVFIHGALSNHQTWRKVIGPLSQSYRCIVPDLPLGGHACAMDTQADLTLPGIIQLLLAFLDHLALEQVVLISNDTGGAYAQVFTAQHPERVAGLVLSNCDCLDVFPPKNFASLQKMINLPSYTFLMAQLFRIESFLVTPGVMGLLSNSLTGEEVKRLYVNAFIQQSGIRRDFQKVVNSWSVTHTLAAAERLASYPKPVAIIWGEEDKQLFPIELGKRLAAVFQRGEFHPVSGAMTYIQEDQAEVFVTLIQQYLSLNIEDNLSLQA